MRSAVALSDCNIRSYLGLRVFKGIVSLGKVVYFVSTRVILQALLARVVHLRSKRVFLFFFL